MRLKSWILASSFLCCTFAAAPVGAQGAPGFHFGAFGGADFPVGDQSSVYKTGWNAGGMFLFNFPGPIGIRLEGAYHEMKTKLLEAFEDAGKTRIISGTA